HDTINSRKGHGIALENVKQRLKAYYGNSVRFQVYKGEALYTTMALLHKPICKGFFSDIIFK
ncbi:hypothetical protein AB2O82_18740, partial [Acinetobacter baumannii]